ncbi:MAG: TauD/TfdA family dioxygenase [Pseudomonadota bacterium]
MKVKKMAAPLGAIVEGVDLRAVDDGMMAELHHLFDEHHVLVFPGQELTPQQQKAFGLRWGELIPHPYAGLDAHPEIIELVNRGKRRDVNQHWHTDMSYNELPPKLTMLYALQAPEFGGETAFANQHLAYEELSDGMKSTLDGLLGVNSAAGLARLYGEDESKASRALHPLVRTHDGNGKRAIYACRSFTTGVDGWRREESKWLLNFLFEHSVRPEYQARHQWRAGDVAMWDNRSVLHYAVHDHGDEARRIHRCQVVGERPI